MSGSNGIRLLRAKEKTAVLQIDQRAQKVVGYIRASTEEQATTGHGLDVQERAIRSFCESQGDELLEIISDAGVSGAKRPEDREGFRRVLELAAAADFSILLVWKFDRLARNLLFSVTTVHELQERYSVNLRSVTEPIDTASPPGAMIFAILASFAAEERRVITSRTLAGKKEKASRGGFAGGAVPLGYKKDLKGGLLVEEAEAEILNQIARMRQEGHSFRAIANSLNQAGVRSKRGAKFYPNTIRYILDNPKYRGFVEYYFRHDGETHCLRPGMHAAILTRAAC